MNGFFDKEGHPQVIIKIEGLTQKSFTIPCLIDSGFDGYLVLPLSVGITLGLVLFGTTYVELADGSKRNELLYLCKVVFDDEDKMVPISLSNSSSALLGTKMLEGKKLMINFKNKTIKIVSLASSKAKPVNQLRLLKKTVSG